VEMISKNKFQSFIKKEISEIRNQNGPIIIPSPQANTPNQKKGNVVPNGFFFEID
jgi:hypothetical protein